jgi:tripartite-type tricarboxylate transporter receptor subunit TctC
VRNRYQQQGAEATPSTPEEFLTYIKQELPKWGQLVKVSGATVD